MTRYTRQGAFDFAPPRSILAAHHYLGPASGKLVHQDEFGVAILSSPTSRRLPCDWLELSRWCLTGVSNGGSRQWARIVSRLRSDMPDVTTIISYSDPSVGHTGALYRACNWLWAPTWHRLCPPPSGSGSWDGIKRQSVKDRWVFVLRPDPRRAGCLSLEPSYIRRFPWAEYREPRWKRGRVVHSTGGADFKSFALERLTV